MSYPSNEANTPETCLLTRAQEETCRAAERIVRQYGAVLLCEETGTGKTWVAAALAGRLQIQTILVAPAHLLEQWQPVMAQFGVNYLGFSYQMASLGRIPEPKSKTLWILDEAHYLKNTATQRYHALIELMAGHYACLVTATPVSMQMLDLYALIRLCGYEWAFDDRWTRSYACALMPKSYVPELTIEKSYEVRRNTVPYHVCESEPLIYALGDCLNQMTWTIVTDDGQCAETHLLGHILWHRLMSHVTSCLKTVRHLEAYYSNCRDGSGHFMTRQTFFKMMGIEGKQLILPFARYAFGTDIGEHDQRQIRQTRQLLQEARLLLETICSMRDEKLEAVKPIIQQSNGPVILFSQYVDTAEYFADALGKRFDAALITSKSAMYRGGEIRRSDLIGLFDPAKKVPVTWENAGFKRPGVLVCSDALSCGHNLQCAQTLIHLDNPWNPTTLRQREGRILRKGQGSDNVAFFQMRAIGMPEIMYQKEIMQFRRVAQREWIQHNWYDGWTFELCATDLMHLELPEIPSWWGKLGNAWLPISQRSFKNHRKPCQITQTTLIRLFEPTIASYRKQLKPIWQWIKAQKYHEEFSDLFERFSTWLLTLLLVPYQFPRHMRLECLGKDDLFSTEQVARLLHNLPNLTMYKWVKPSTCCYWIQIYPQHEAQNSIQRPLVIHNPQDKNPDFLPQKACQS